MFSFFFFFRDQVLHVCPKMRRTDVTIKPTRSEITPCLLLFERMALCPIRFPDQERKAQSHVLSKDEIAQGVERRKEQLALIEVFRGTARNSRAFVVRHAKTSSKVPPEAVFVMTGALYSTCLGSRSPRGRPRQRPRRRLEQFYRQR